MRASFPPGMPLIYLLLAMSSGGVGGKAAIADDETALASKVSFKLANGILQNRGSLGGSSPAIAELDLSYQRFLTPSFALGLGYRIDFNYSDGTVPLRGANLISRYYLSGAGTRVSSEHEGSRSESTDRFAYFVGLDLYQRDYYLGLIASVTSSSRSSQVPFTGSYYSLNGVVGAEWLISRNWQFVAEGSVGLETFAASDSRLSLQDYLVSVGFSFIW